MEWTLTQTEALGNECKGHVFEFLLGLEIATDKNCRERFFQEFGDGYKKQLRLYETWLRKHRPHLVRCLPKLAKSCAEALRPHLPSTLDRVVVLGKLTGSYHKNIFKEADLIVVSQKKLIPISLKLCKQGSFVNTKSGGIFSFLRTYFFPFYGGETRAHQMALNTRVQTSFYHMGRDLYAKEGLEFQGHFDAQWTEKHSELPGQLPKEHRPLVFDHYKRVIEQVYMAFTSFAKKPLFFQKALTGILGLGEKELIQLMCFHTGTDTYDLSDIEILKMKDIALLCQGYHLGPPPLQSSFDVFLKNRTLQIRVKPMNKFTVTGLKVNCSVKRQ